MMNKRITLILSILILCCQPDFLSAQNGKNDINLQKVVIDPGHGGRDPGAVGAFSYEKDIVLNIAHKLGGYIEENFPDVEVIYTRKTDKYVKLYERAKIANNAKADLFISIHANASTSSKPYGAETFVMGLHVSEANLKVAKKENAVILQEENYEENYGDFNPNSPESHIMFSMFQNAYLDQSLNLAALVQEQFKERVGRHDRGVKQAGFWVLYKVAMPSILIESGFISNPEEEKFLNSEDGVTYLASAIYRAFKAYKKAFEADNLLKEESLEVYLDESDNHSIEKDTANKENNIPSFPPSENDEICFRIQIGTSKDSIDTLQNMYPAFNDLWQYKHNEYYKHTTEKTDDYQKIVSLHEKLSANIKDCFIVAFRNNQRITVRDAIKTINQ
ncbi:MAG: N-acetylmuramoyl-L-alanine amidase [Bacteroidota bacterium]|nr:N-acetylmuramoyl-L-alanine amidase [Bacteroidota bacterium]